MKTASVPLMLPLDLSRWHQPISSHVQVSHDRYQGHPHEESSPAPVSETPELAHPIPRQFTRTPAASYSASPEGPPTWPRVHAVREQTMTPVAYKTDIPYPLEDFYPRMTPTYSYSQPINWSPEQVHEKAMDRGNEREEKEVPERCRRHICPVCDKRFNRPSSLGTHMSVHTGAKPHQCPRSECGRKFSVSSNLRRHERTHRNATNSNATEPVHPKPQEYHPAPHAYYYYPSPYAYPEVPPLSEASTSSSSTSSTGLGLARYQVTRRNTASDLPSTPGTPARAIGSLQVDADKGQANLPAR